MSHDSQHLGSGQDSLPSGMAVGCSVSSSVQHQNCGAEGKEEARPGACSQADLPLVDSTL